MPGFVSMGFVCLLGVPPPPQAVTAPTVDVRVDQHGGLTRQQLDIAIDQLRQIWRPAGVTVTSGLFGTELRPESAIVSLRVVGGQQPSIGGRPVLAWVARAEGRGRVPTLFVSLTATREFLLSGSYRGRPLNQRPRAILDRLLPQAVGRVAAHELGHYLLGDRPHDRTGLMRPVYTPEDLVAASLAPFEVPPDHHVALRREILRLSAGFSPERPSWSR